MKRFFTALCVLCLTAIFASAEEPELIERPLSWTIDSIQIVWNIEEKQTENYEWRSISDRSNTTSVDSSNLSRDTNSTTNTSEKHFSTDAEASVKGGVGFDGGFFASWGLQGSAGMSTGLGWKQEDLTANTQQNEWVKSENTTYKASESEDASKGNQTLRYNRKLLFTVNFVNHAEKTLLMAPDAANTIPIYCRNDHLGNARPVITTNEIFRIPATGNPYPCQFEMELNDSSKAKLLQSAPDIRILGSQIKIFNDEYDDAFTQSIQRFPHFTVRLTADGASRDWEFRYNKKSDYTLQEVLEAINEDCKDEDLFELSYGGTIVSVAGFPVKPSKESEALVLLAWNGKPITDLKDLKPRKNGVLDVILVSRTILETHQSATLTTLIPFKETLKMWVKDGLFNGKYLTLNLMNQEERLAEIKHLAEAGDEEMQRELESQRKAGLRKILTVDGCKYAFRWCPPGEFMMGGESVIHNAKPVHKVKLTRGFWMLETEVTQAMWQSVMDQSVKQQSDKVEVKYKRPRGEGPNYPMYYVSWDDCQEFCQKLSQMLGRQVKLPTEAQWEYACRAGSTGDYAGDLDSMAWHGDFVGSTHLVAQKKPNAWGLYDMHGNVEEWCSDYYGEKYYDMSPTSDPENTEASPSHVVRGGCWGGNLIGDGCQSSTRSGGSPGVRSDRLGFRILLVPQQED